MKKKQAGFTLIELIIVIIIVGILAAVAVPKFIDLSSDAQQKAADAVAGALSAANGANYASRKEKSTNGVAIANCTDMSSALQGGLPTGYVITAAAVAADVTVTCTITGPTPGSKTATFSATGIA